ncbi:MAG TPA: hypothetical protein VMU87_11860 [Stellaceae bacterium]|nr:hypothetical protein [Stellaceae bacterium]
MANTIVVSRVQTIIVVASLCFDHSALPAETPSCECAPSGDPTSNREQLLELSMRMSFSCGVTIGADGDPQKIDKA